jgi:hypothetical protein
MLIGLPAASAVYLLACRSLDIEQDRKQAAAADLGLDCAESLLEPRLAEQRRYPPARLASEE